MAKTPVAPAAPTPPPAPSAVARKRSAAVELDTLPGHHIRRLQQIAVALFLQEAEPLGVTPVQYAVLQAVANEPGLDQRTLAGRVALDTSTVAGVVDRLEARALLQRHASATDRRVRQLLLTPEGEALRAQVEPAMRRAQQRILAPLPRAERAEFLRLLRVLVDGNNEASRAPGELG
jgi:DNA-binding MarR family transcriptional regulator